MPSTPQLPNWASEAAEEDWIAILGSLQSEQEIRDFLELTLTHGELKKIGCRFRAITLLCSGLTPGQVKEISTNSTNISRGLISKANGYVSGRSREVCLKFYERLKQIRQN